MIVSGRLRIRVCVTSVWRERYQPELCRGEEVCFSVLFDGLQSWDIINENEALALCKDQAEFEVLPGVYLEVAVDRFGLLSKLRRRKLTDGTRISISVRNRRWHCSSVNKGDDSFKYESRSKLQPIIASSVPIQDHCGGHCYVRTLLDSSGLTDESSPPSSCESSVSDALCRFRLISYSEAIESLLRAGKLRAICEKDPSRYCVALWESLKNGTTANTELSPIRLSHNRATGITRVLDGNHRLCCTRTFGLNSEKVEAIVDAYHSPGDTDSSGFIRDEGYFSSRRFRVSSKTVMRRYFQLLNNLHLDRDEGGALLDAPFESLCCWIDGFLQ